MPCPPRAIRLVLAAAFAAAGCSAVRWSGAPPGGSPRDVLHPPPSLGGPEIELPPVGSGRERPARAEIPAPSPAQRRAAMFPSDLGPDDIDIAPLPLQQRRNYRVYRDACSRCHGLSRSLWAPHTSTPWLEFYLTSMRARGRLRGAPFTAEEIAAVRDFLRYDAAERKSGAGAEEFRLAGERLRVLFDEVVSERMKDLQDSPTKVRP